ncbi:unnamed protein product [Haemonchus placei]|uniref:Kinesin motor domain-containing protein n=1 Tax=Haemonchus placei TaxID=6290 RepID=A0A0N4X4T8_HAEPC|nr:unnamed protein product [Haemonchus placei]
MMSDDYVYQGFDRQHAVALAYFDVLDRVATMGRDLREVIRPPTAERPALLALQSITQVMSKADCSNTKLRIRSKGKRRTTFLPLCTELKTDAFS